MSYVGGKNLVTEVILHGGKCLVAFGSLVQIPGMALIFLEQEALILIVSLHPGYGYLAGR